MMIVAYYLNATYIYSNDLENPYKNQIVKSIIIFVYGEARESI